MVVMGPGAVVGPGVEVVVVVVDINKQASRAIDMVSKQRRKWADWERI